MIRSNLVAVDGSEGSKKAMELACDQGKKLVSSPDAIPEARTLPCLLDAPMTATNSGSNRLSRFRTLMAKR